MIADGARATGPAAGRAAMATIGVVAGIKLLLHLATNHDRLGYGYFRDEFYYLACAERLAFGYVDHPPLSVALLALSRALLGDSLPALRLLPAMAGALTVVLTGLIARRLGGGAVAVALATLAVTFAPILLIINGIYSPGAFEVLWWTVAAALLVVLVEERRPRLWLAVGLTLGLALQTKHTALVLGVGVLAGLLLTPARRHLRERWPWLGAGLALLVMAPNLVWQAGNGWPSLEFYAAAAGKNVATPPHEILLMQALVLNPVTLPVWLAGLGYYLFDREGRNHRMLGWIYVVLMVAMIAAQSSRPDRPAGAYPMLFAAGGVVLERLLRAPRRRAPAVAALVVLIAGGIAFLPVGLPILPPARMAAYAGAIGLTSASMERDKRAALPQYFADRFGWEELVATVAEVFHRLPPEERSAAAIYTGNYGEAGAIDFFGPRHGLPKAISGHNHYHLWGPGDFDGRVLIALGVRRASVEEAFAEVAEAGVTRCRYCMDYENGLPVYVARGMRDPVAAAWRRGKHFQ